MLPSSRPACPGCEHNWVSLRQQKSPGGGALVCGVLPEELKILSSRKPSPKYNTRDEMRGENPPLTSRIFFGLDAIPLITTPFASSAATTDWLHPLVSRQLGSAQLEHRKPRHQNDRPIFCCSVGLRRNHAGRRPLDLDTPECQRVERPWRGMPSLRQGRFLLGIKCHCVFSSEHSGWQTGYPGRIVGRWGSFSRS